MSTLTTEEWIQQQLKDLRMKVLAELDEKQKLTKELADKIKKIQEEMDIGQARADLLAKMVLQLTTDPEKKESGEIPLLCGKGNVDDTPCHSSCDRFKDHMVCEYAYVDKKYTKHILEEQEHEHPVSVEHV